MAYIIEARLVFALCIFVMAAGSITACSQSPTTTVETSPVAPVQGDEITPDESSAPIRFSGDCSIMIQSVGMESNDHISVYGSCLLSKNACIVTQLLDHGEVVTWWPANACATIEDGHWHIDVPLEGNNLEVKGYRVHAWERENDAIAPARYPFSIEIGEGNALVAVPPSLPEPTSPSVGGSVSGLLNDDRAVVRIYSPEDTADGSWTEVGNGPWKLVVMSNSIGTEHFTVTAEADGYRTQPSHYTIAADCQSAYVVRDDEIEEEAIDLDFRFIPDDKSLLQK